MSAELVTQETNQYWKIKIFGQVQGVGFRPFIYSLTNKLRLYGRVYNSGADVIVELKTSKHLLDGFLTEVKTNAPNLSRVDNIAVDNNVSPFEKSLLDKSFYSCTFDITDSIISEKLSLNIAADAAPCEDCLTELFDVKNKRYLYPFINCTQCGPRFSIIKKLPYDRPNTTMASFEQCDFCQTEYNNPLSRRFHAQPNACPSCGPQLLNVDKTNIHTFVEDLKEPFPKSIQGGYLEQIKRVVESLLNGDIVAIKSVGGFHLVCDARNVSAVNMLRKRKNRPTKPLAVMTLNAKSAEQWVDLTAEDEHFLFDKSAPILILPLKNSGGKLEQLLAPGLEHLGVMFPQSPLHWMIYFVYLNYYSDSVVDFDHSKNSTLKRENVASTLKNSHCNLTLVMTSANLSGEPLITDNNDAFEKLNEIADLFLFHDRDIHTRCDDSVFIKRGLNYFPTRVARGFSPVKFEIQQFSDTVYSADSERCVLALGSYLKNTVAINRGSEVCVSQYIGDLDHPDNCKALVSACDRLLEIMQIKPTIIACDLHPEGFARVYAQELSEKFNAPIIEVPHHIAHIHSVMLDQSIHEPVLGLALDGYGYGWDKTSRGGELVLIDNNGFAPLFELERIAQPGGDIAAKEPWRMALALCFKLGMSLEDAQSLLIKRFSYFNKTISSSSIGLVWRMLSANINCSATTSAGRWFDAVAGLLGLCEKQSYEGEAAMLLEAKAIRFLKKLDGVNNNSSFKNSYLESLIDQQLRLVDSTFSLDSNSITAIVLLSAGLKEYVPHLSRVTSSGDSYNEDDIVEKIAFDFHMQIAKSLSQIIKNTFESNALFLSDLSRKVIFSGGCAQNQLLYIALRTLLKTENIELVLPSRVPVNDAGISLGQLHYALHNAH